VVYHDFDPDIEMEVITTFEDVVYFDVDDDGVDDFNLDLFAYNLSPARGYFRDLDFRGRSALGYASYWGAGIIGTRLSTGEEIGLNPGSGLLFGSSAQFAYYYYGPNIPFAGEVGYLGFRFVAGDGM